jgi:hypothetical protein
MLVVVPAWAVSVPVLKLLSRSSSHIHQLDFKKQRLPCKRMVGIKHNYLIVDLNNDSGNYLTLRRR